MKADQYSQCDGSIFLDDNKSCELDDNHIFLGEDEKALVVDYFNLDETKGDDKNIVYNNKQSEAPPSEQLPSEGTHKYYCCTVCNKKYKSPKWLQAHKLKHIAAKRPNDKRYMLFTKCALEVLGNDGCAMSQLFLNETEGPSIPIKDSIFPSMDQLICKYIAKYQGQDDDLNDIIYILCYYKKFIDISVQQYCHNMKPYYEEFFNYMEDNKNNLEIMSKLNGENFSDLIKNTILCYNDFLYKSKYTKYKVSIT